MNDNPFVKPEFVQPRRTPDGGVDVVILDRIEPGEMPDYCTHGRAGCIACDEWCWLGDKTHDVVAGGDAAPLCRQCAARLIPADVKPSERIHDHRRADGPHA